MRLRLLTEADYDALYALWLSCEGMGLNDKDDSPAGIGRYLRRNPETCFGMEADGRLVGAILAGHDGRRGFIHHTAVHPAYQRQGIGTALVRAALEAFRAEGINKAALLVFKRNERGNAFWEKQGFTLREDVAYRNLALAEMRRINT